MKQFKAALASLMLMLCTIAITACSDNDDPQPNTYNWRKDLISVKTDIYSDRNYPTPLTCYISILDKNGADLLNDTYPDNLCDSDWYFIVDGKEYRRGQIIPVANSNEPIDVRFHVVGEICCIAPTWIDWKTLKEGPVHQSLTFVFPEKGIKKRIDFYAEINPDLDVNAEDVYELYKKGVWVDGKPLDCRFGWMGIWTIIL